MSISVPKVSPFSEEFGYCEQKLRLQLDAPSLVITDMFNISLRPINVQFTNFVKSHQPANVMDVFIPTELIRQSKSDIVTQGLKIHQRNGFVFHQNCLIGNVEDKTYELLHLQVALGAVLNYQDKRAPLDKVKYIQTPPTVDCLPEGFHSLRVGENRYCVFSPNQIKALHILHVTFEHGVSDASPGAKICDMCHQHNASLYCYNDQKRFCEHCDHDIHSQNEILNDHKRVPLYDGLIEMQKCPEHPHLNVMYYCLKCHLPICLDCKVKGSHAHGEASKHKLIPIDQAYKEALFQYQTTDPIFVSRENAINRGLAECERKLDEIQANQQAVEDEIMRIAMKAIDDSRLQSAATANEVKSAQLEYLRKLEEYKKEREIVRLYKEEAEPVPFLQAVARKELLQEEMRDNLDLPLPLKVQGNLIVYGRVEVGPPKPAPPKEQDRDINQVTQTYTYSTTESSYLEPSDPKWTRLSKMAFRKQSKYDSLGIVLPFHPFTESRIVADATMAERLYLCLPFKGTPQPHLLFSTELHSRNIRTMHKMIDEMGITCVLVQVGEQKFGGFAATKWVPDGIPKKDKNSTFLFQLTKDAFIPYGGQSEDPCYICSTQDTLQFGDGDLKLAGLQFDHCSSQLENSFGLGFLYDSQKAKEFMAGRHHFSPDIVEVWGFFQTE